MPLITVMVSENAVKVNILSKRGTSKTAAFPKGKQPPYFDRYLELQCRNSLHIPCKNSLMGTAVAKNRRVSGRNPHRNSIVK